MSAVAHYFTPVEGPSPAGREARLDPEHEQLRGEIGKLSDVRGQVVDWPMVQTVGSQILLAHSKDLLIASYVACALTAQRGLSGAAEGSELVSGLLTQFGATLFPTRQRARANALNWYLEWMTAYLDGARTDNAAEVLAVRNQLRALNDVTMSVLGPDAPMFDAVLRSCERLERSVVAEVPDPPPLAPVSEVAPAVVEAPKAAASDGAELAAWLAPLADAPAGVDSSYDEQHVAVRVEIEKLQALGGEQPNWRAVQDGSAALLRTVSKDLTLATYLAAALLEQRGALGFSEGVRLCAGLLERYWDTMWPPVARAKRRANALDWLCERATQRIAAGPAPAPEDKVALELALAELKTQVDARFPGGLPSLVALSEALAKVATASVVAAPPAPAVQSHEIAAPVAPPVAAAPVVSSAERASAEYIFQAPPSAPAEVANYALRAGSLIIDLARARFEADRKDARAYRWARTGAWLRWERAPGANRRGRIDTDGPPPPRRAELAKALEAEQWDEALSISEQLVTRVPLWLDANRYSALALARLGPEYAAARAHVEVESRAFFARLPQLAELQFADGSALVGADTIAWLRPPRAAGGAAAQVELSAPLVERLQKADRAALGEFEELLKACRSQRSSFLLRLELARALERGEQHLKAANVYLGLERDLDAHGIEQWEPELALQVLQPLWSLLSRGSPLGVVQTEAARVCARLARLLPTALL